jgi:WhiB family redox-sensing transcriptional regulator
MELGLCATRSDVQFFTDDDENPFDEEPAKTLCAACPVRIECLEHAFQNNEIYGIWGGMSPVERDSIVNRKRSTPLPKGQRRSRTDPGVPQRIRCPRCLTSAATASNSTDGTTARCYDCKITFPVL